MFSLRCVDLPLRVPCASLEEVVAHLSLEKDNTSCVLATPNDSSQNIYGVKPQPVKDEVRTGVYVIDVFFSLSS